MYIAIYQIDTERDGGRAAFLPYGELMRRNGAVDPEIYGKAFEGWTDADDLEEVYEKFNLGCPDGFRGRSMSVSDVMAVTGEDGETRHYYCDSVGFTEINFDEDLAERDLTHRISVVVCEPGKTARRAEIGTGLDELQKAVGGTIETYYPFDEEVCIVCNDEGKLNGMKPCRAVYDAEGKVMDVVFGPFFVCDCSGPDFRSLSPEQMERYWRMFERPERFFKLNGEIVAIPCRPDRDREQAM